jgi:uracil-DNA glycosylase family 4
VSSGGSGDALAVLEREVVGCRRCPRLVAWREEVARVKRASFASEEYWGRPLPGFGDRLARVLVLGLAPAAHGGNRTGRIFTGDRSGDWLFAALWRAGFANQPVSVSVDDGLSLKGCWVTAAVRCAPPRNRPTPAERDNCLPYLERELVLLRSVRVIVCLGSFAWDAALRGVGAVLGAGVAEGAARARGARGAARAGGAGGPGGARGPGLPLPRPRPRFGHGASAEVGRYLLLGCYHPSQQNTFTGRLTEEMMDEVFARAREHGS